MNRYLLGTLVVGATSPTGPGASSTAVSRAQNSSTRAMNVGRQLAKHHPSAGQKLMSMSQKLSQSASSQGAAARAAAAAAATKAKRTVVTPASAATAAKPLVPAKVSFAAAALHPAAATSASPSAASPFSFAANALHLATATAPKSAAAKHRAVMGLDVVRWANPTTLTQNVQQQVVAPVALAPSVDTSVSPFAPPTDDSNLNAQVSYVDMATQAGQVLNNISPLISQLGNSPLAASGNDLATRAQTLIDAANDVHQQALAAHRAM